MWASRDWLGFTGFTSASIVGHPLATNEMGPTLTLAATVALGAGQPISADVTSHTRHGIAFRHTIELQPLINSRGDAAVFKVLSTNVELLLERGVLLPTMSSIAALTAAQHASHIITEKR